MKQLKYFISAVIALAICSLQSCIDDDTNKNYLSDFDAGEIVIDTIGVANRMVLVANMTPGDRIEFEPNVTYKYPERLRYRWFYLTLTNYSYEPIEVGNTSVYPQGDTISCAKKLDWIVDLNPGQYRFYMMAEDSISGIRAYYQAEEQYVVVSGKSSQGGLYLLVDRNGSTDIDVFTSELMLMYGGESKQYLNYFSQLTGTPLPGKPRWIRGSHTGKQAKNGYLVCTDQNLYRIAQQDLTVMDEWKDMFYDTPAVFNPQCAFFDQNLYCDFLINDGKLYTLYSNKPNSRKFSAPIAGDYEADAYLMFNARTTWRPLTGAIGADQVIYDKKNHAFKPYYPFSSSLGSFKSTNGDAWLDANHLPADPVKILNAGGNQTYCIMLIDGVYHLYRYNFYNRVDNGDLSADGNYSDIDLSGCENLSQAKYWASCASGYAFYYATDKALYSFSPSSGITTSYTIYECEPTEEITCVYAGGSNGGGYPTSDVPLWLGIWDSAKQEGKLIEWEMGHSYGRPNAMWGPMFGMSRENPTITTGWGKIVGMTLLGAE